MAKQLLPFMLVASLLSVRIDAATSESLSTYNYSDGNELGLFNVMTELILKPSKKTLTNKLEQLSQDDQVQVCQRCHEFSVKVRRILTRASLAPDIAWFSAQFCLTVFPQLSGACLSKAEMVGNRTIAYLQALFQVDGGVCGNIGVCPTATAAATVATVPIPSGLPSILMTRVGSDPSAGWLLDEGEIVSTLMEIVLQQLGETRICIACRAILSRLRTTLRNPMTQAVVLKVLLNACTMAKRRYIPKCKRMVAKYGPVSVVLLTRFVNVVDLCNITHFCQLVAAESRDVVCDQPMCQILQRDHDT